MSTKRARRVEADRPYAGHATAHPDPAPADPGRLDRLKARAPTLLRALITDSALAAPERRVPEKPLAELTKRQRRQRDAQIRAAERKVREDIDRRAKEARLEERAEDQAPAIQRATVTGLTAPMIRAARIAAEKAGKPFQEPSPITLREPIAEPDHQRRAYRAVMVIDQLHQRSPKDFPKRLVRAGRQLMRDYQLGVEGAKGGGRAPPGVANDPDAPGPLDHQFKALANYRAAMQALGPSAAGIVSGIVLCNYTVTSLAAYLGSHSVDRTTGRVIAALERLHEHYHPPQPSTHAPPPIPAAPDGLPWDGLGEPPDDRIGRWRAA